MIKFIGDNFPVRNTEQYKHVEGDIFEIKPTDKIRIFCFQRGGKLIITNGCIKKRWKLRTEDIERAETLMNYYDNG